MGTGNSQKARFFGLLVLFLMIAPLGFAQQTGAIVGKITSGDGQALPGVTVVATAPSLPQARVVTTGLNGDYRLPLLPPGTYSLEFNLAGMETQTRNVRVQLNQDSTVNVKMALAGVAETITVTADSSLVDPTSTAIRSAVTEEMIEQLPVGQEYRDLLKLAPAIQVNEAGVRGPSSGGSEQDNVYQFDGVNVTLPLFGTLAAEPSTQDIEQVSIIKGGAKAIDFNRSAGFTIDSVSKSGTSEWSGVVEYQLQSQDWVADIEGATGKVYDRDKDWATFGIGGPLVQDMLFFYGSYYRPTESDANSATRYGPVGDYDSTRDEFFGKFTFTPASNLLFNASYRDSDREVKNASISGSENPSLSTGETSGQTIGIFEASWIITDNSYATFKYNDYELLTSARPDNMLSVVPSGAVGSMLDLDNLDQMGYIDIPSFDPDEPAFNQFITPFVARYSYDPAAGGGAVGGASQINNNDFYRQSMQVEYDMSFGDFITHDLHFGFMQYTDEEDLSRFSNGWGYVTIPGGLATFEDQPVYFQAEFQRSNQGNDPGQVIHSEFESNNFEINDTIRWNDWSFNVGVLLSNDILYGQGLREDSSTISGYVADPGNQYKMYEIDWQDQIQPRLGATWAYNGLDTVYASYARYNSAASSLPRAASWDRNTLGLVTRAYFDENGELFASEQLSSSSGKLFADDLDPRYTDEIVLGTAKQVNDDWSARVYGRYRYSANFWEDTNNNARSRFNPPAGVPTTDYIPDLDEKRDQIGSGSSYVIAELDGAFTKYYEATFESDYRATDNLFLRGSYTWSHYYGNFDQDSTSTTYDFATFIGSSNIADGAGRQIWDNKYGNLHGDRRHLLKLFAIYDLNFMPWDASVGVFGLYQSGHAWEAWSYEPYSDLTGSTSDTNRYAEPAGSRTTPSHYQVDINYTQNIPIAGLNLQLVADMFNVTDNQTGYSPYPASPQLAVRRSAPAARTATLPARSASAVLIRYTT